jgi:O-antigen/teichoic acid export membrane protein
MLKNGIYITLSNVMRAVMGIITIPLLIKILGIEEYGLWTLVYSTIALVFTLEGGIAMAATVFITRDLADLPNLSRTLSAIALATLCLSLLSMAATYGSAPALVGFFSALSPQQAQQAQLAIQFGSLAVGARLLQQLPISIQQATHQYGSLSLLNLLLATLTTFALLPVAALGGRVVELMECFAFANVFVLIVGLLVVSTWFRGSGLRFQWHGPRLWDFLHYSCFTWLSSIGSLLFLRGDRLIVGKILDIKTLGIYAAITDITVQINNLSAFPVQPLLPTIGSLWQPSQIAGDSLGDSSCRWQSLSAQESALQKVVREGTQINALVAVGLGSILFYAAPQLFQLLTTRPPTGEEILCFRIAIVGYTIYSLNAVAYFALFAIGSARIASAIHLGCGAFALFCIAIGVAHGGLLGAAIGNLGYATTLLMVIVSLRQMQIPLRSWLKWLKFPLLWFSVAVLICILLEGYLLWQYLLLTLQLVALAIWFALAYPLNIKKFG